MSPNKENIHLTNWEIVSVNPTNKNWNWKDIFCFWTVGTQSIISFALLGSLYLLYNLNFYEEHRYRIVHSEIFLQPFHQSLSLPDFLPVFGFFQFVLNEQSFSVCHLN